MVKHTECCGASSQEKRILATMRFGVYVKSGVAKRVRSGRFTVVQIGYGVNVCSKVEDETKEEHNH